MLVEKPELWADCKPCEGDGSLTISMGDDPPEEITCFYCNGEGKTLLGEIDLTDLVDTVADILNQVHAIKQKLDEAFPAPP